MVALTLVRGPSGEKVGHFSDIERKKVGEELAEGTWIRWLIAEEDGAPLFAMRLFEVETGGWIKAHRHPWEHEIYVVSGTGDVRIGEKVYRVSDGYFLYIPPNVEHEYWNRGERPLIFVCVIPHRPTTQAVE